MVDYSTWVEFDGRKVPTLRDILPEKPGVRALFVAKTPTHASVKAVHYFQGKQGQMFWRQLKKYGILTQRTGFEDDSLLEHGFGLTDIVKVPRDYGNEPSSKEYAAGISRILNLIQLHKPTVVIFIYKRVLDRVLPQHFKAQTKSAYGFNPSLYHHFGAHVFAFPLPAIRGRTTPTIDSAMRELGSVLGHGSLTIPERSSNNLAAPDGCRSGSRLKGVGQGMRPTREMADLILRRFEEQGWSQVRGYNRRYKRFGYIGKTVSSVIVSREDGQDTQIRISIIEQGISAVRSDPTIYAGGPNKLRQQGITHVNSVVWSLLHLISEAEICE